MDFSVTSVYINVSMYLYCLSASACISFAKSIWIFFCFLLFEFAGCHFILFHFVFR